jgi:uncharacterized membrane protein (UPF0136 family)
MVFFVVAVGGAFEGRPVLAAALAVYGLFLMVGGWIGKVRAGSNASLIAGVASGVISMLAAVSVLIEAVSPMGRVLGLLNAIVLAGIFGVRYSKGRKFMPSGMMGILSLVVAAGLAVSFAFVP